MNEIKTTDTNASDVMQLHLYAIKDYETSFLNADPKVANVYRHIGLYRLFNSAQVLDTNCTWMVQAVIEAEMRRDNVIIDTVDQFDEYYDNFVFYLGVYNDEFKNNEDVKRLIGHAFDNIYATKGFIDEKE